MLTPALYIAALLRNWPLVPFGVGVALSILAHGHLLATFAVVAAAVVAQYIIAMAAAYHGSSAAMVYMVRMLQPEVDKGLILEAVPSSEYLPEHVLRELSTQAGHEIICLYADALIPGVRAFQAFGGFRTILVLPERPSDCTGVWRLVLLHEAGHACLTSRAESHRGRIDRDSLAAVLLSFAAASRSAPLGAPMWLLGGAMGLFGIVAISYRVWARRQRISNECAADTAALVWFHAADPQSFRTVAKKFRRGFVETSERLLGRDGVDVRLSHYDSTVDSLERGTVPSPFPPPIPRSLFLLLPIIAIASGTMVGMPLSAAAWWAGAAVGLGLVGLASGLLRFYLVRHRLHEFGRESVRVKDRQH